MHKKEYIIHTLFIILALSIISFMLYIFIINMNLVQIIIFSSILILFFRSFYQPISSHVFLSLFFIFSKKKYEIRKQENSNKYMIVHTLKTFLKPYFYTNKIIDSMFTFFINIMFTDIKYKHKKEFSNDFFIILKRDLEKNDVDHELKNLIRKQKYKQIL